MLKDEKNFNINKFKFLIKHYFLLTGLNSYQVNKPENNSCLD